MHSCSTRIRPMKLEGIDHVALITHDLTGTIHFYRDLLGLPLTAALAQEGVRHYLFALGTTQLAFFAYADAAAVPRKRHGVCTAEPRGFDHVSFSTSSCEELFAWRDLLRAAGVEVSGPVD